MKMSLKIYNKVILSLTLLCLISCSTNGNIKSVTNLNKVENETQSLPTNTLMHNDNILLKEIKKPHLHIKHKSHKKTQSLKSLKRLKHKSYDQKLKTDNDLIETKETNSSPQTDSFLYVSWFIFVPLVLLIFIMTILSIAGFLILILNSTASTGCHSQNHNPITQTALRSRNLTHGNLSNAEILEILKYKHQMKKKNKSNKNTGYKPEPEPEGVVFRS